MFTNLLWRLQRHQVEDVHVLENLALILVSEEFHLGNHYCAFSQRLSRHDAEVDGAGDRARVRGLGDNRPRYGTLGDADDNRQGAATFP